MAEQIASLQRQVRFLQLVILSGVIVVCCMGAQRTQKQDQQFGELIVDKLYVGANPDGAQIVLTSEGDNADIHIFDEGTDVNLGVRGKKGLLSLARGKDASLLATTDSLTLKKGDALFMSHPGAVVVQNQKVKAVAAISGGQAMFFTTDEGGRNTWLSPGQ